MKTRQTLTKRIAAAATALLLLLSVLPMSALAAEIPAPATVFTFTDGGVAAQGGDAGYTIEGAVLQIIAPGVYAVTGACAEGRVTVAKDAGEVTLVMRDLALTSAKGPALACAGGSQVTLWIDGAVTLSASKNEKGGEPAAIRVRSGAALSVDGTGTLTVNGACRGGMTGAARSAVKVVGGTLLTLSKNGASLTPAEGVSVRFGSAGKVSRTHKAQPKAAEKTAEQITEETTEQVTAQTPEEVAEETAKQAAEQSEKTTKTAKKEQAKTHKAAPSAKSVGRSVGMAAKKAGTGAKKNGADKTAPANKKPQITAKQNFSINVGDTVEIKDSEGNILYTAIAGREAGNVIFSSPALTADQTYTLYVNGTEAAASTARNGAQKSVHSANQTGAARAKGGVGRLLPKDVTDAAATEPAAAADLAPVSDPVAAPASSSEV